MISSPGRDWFVSRDRSNNGAGLHYGREMNGRSQLWPSVLRDEALLISATT